jgi:hypothetical protein
MAYLGFEKRQQSPTDNGLAIERRVQMVRVISAGWYVGDPQQSSEGILFTLVIAFAQS